MSIDSVFNITFEECKVHEVAIDPELEEALAYGRPCGWGCEMIC